MDSYANAAVATFEAGQTQALRHWLMQTALNKQMELFLLSSHGDIVGLEHIPAQVHAVLQQFMQGDLTPGLIRTGNTIISHEIHTKSGTSYRLVAISETPLLSHALKMPWAGLSIIILVTIVLSGVLCYHLSVYLTKPLRAFRQAVKTIVPGPFNTPLPGKYKDEIDELKDEFDRMANQLADLINTNKRLLQDISHELRSPLARLQIAIELGRNLCQPTAEREFSRMEVECQRLNTLIGEILDLARLDKTQMEMKKTRVYLPTVLEHIMDDANFEFSRESTRVFATTIEPCYALVNETLLHRAIENVLRNALRYSPEKEPVTIGLYRDPLSQEVVIDIKDNGTGVPEDQLEKIFSPFYRVDSAREKKTGGYGLGLSIAQQAIALHDGTITAKNSPGGGFLVSIRLPKE